MKTLMEKWCHRCESLACRGASHRLLGIGFLSHKLPHSSFFWSLVDNSNTIFFLLFTLFWQISRSNIHGKVQLKCYVYLLTFDRVVQEFLFYSKLLILLDLFSSLDDYVIVFLANKKKMNNIDDTHQFDFFEPCQSIFTHYWS